jgi:hypothetical protein
MLCLSISTIGSAALAEDASVYLGSHFRDAGGYPLYAFGSVADVVARLGLGAQLHVRGVNDCRELAEIPQGKERGYNSLRDTYTIIQSVKIACWAVLQVDPAARVRATTTADRITPDIIHGIMANAVDLSARNEEWMKALTAFSGGVITRWDDERFRLSLPDGNDPPDESLLVELMLVTGDERFIEVTQLFRGRSGFVYGIRWRETEIGGEVLEIFPDIER